MKRVLVSFLILLFLIALGFYVSYSQNPFDIEKVRQLAVNQELYTDAEILAKIPEYINNGLIWEIVDVQIFTGWMVIVGLITLNLITFIHLLIDKLFFRKFFEQPALFPAIRRGAWFGITVIGIIFLRLVDGLYWYNAASIVFLFLCIEILILNLNNKNGKRSKT